MTDQPESPTPAHELFDASDIEKLGPERVAALTAKFTPAAAAAPVEAPASTLEDAQKRLARSIGPAASREVTAILEPLMRSVQAYGAQAAKQQRASLESVYPELKADAAWALVNSSGDPETTARTLYGSRQKLNTSENPARRHTAALEVQKLPRWDRMRIGADVLRRGGTQDEALAAMGVN